MRKYHFKSDNTSTDKRNNILNNKNDSDSQLKSTKAKGSTAMLSSAKLK